MAGQGNPNHAPAGAPGGTGGQFVSGPQSGTEEAKAKKKTTKAVRKKPNKPTEKMAGGFASLFAKLQDINSTSEVPLLSNIQDVKDNMGKFFSEKTTKHLDSLYGNSTGCAHWQFHPKAHQSVSLNLFTCVFGKYRYKDNHAHLIGADDFAKMEADKAGFDRIYRGITSTGERAANIMLSYASNDINNLDIYGNGCWGTNVYTTVRISYASSYAGYGGTLINGVLDKRAKYIDSNDLETMQSSITASDEAEMEAKAKEAMMSHGLDEDRAGHIARSFVKSLTRDESLLAIMLGYDYQISDSHQRNILNLGKWYIRKDF